MTTRNSKGQIVKGHSGNPSGKPKILTALNPQTGEQTDVAELYLMNAGPVFVKLFQTIMSPKTADAPRVTAIREFNDRAFGKAKLAPTTRTAESEDEFDLSALPRDIQARIVALKERDADPEE